jgi:hypothetical protein
MLEIKGVGFKYFFEKQVEFKHDFLLSLCAFLGVFFKLSKRNMCILYN